MAPIIRVEHLRKVYRVGKEKVVALNDVSLAVEPGEFCCIVGASGSGKSTLLNLLGSMTAAENVALPLMFQGVDRKTRLELAKAELARMGLASRADHRPTEMSGGQQQRVGIARAFVCKPKVIFADEPTGNLDTVTTRKVLGRILKMAKENGITFVMVTHERELAGCADRVVTISDGNVQSDRVLTEEEKAAGRAALGVDQLEDLDVADALAHEKEDSGKKQARHSKHLFKNPIKIKRNAK